KYALENLLGFPHDTRQWGRFCRFKRHSPDHPVMAGHGLQRRLNCLLRLCRRCWRLDGKLSPKDAVQRGTTLRLGIEVMGLGICDGIGASRSLLTEWVSSPSPPLFHEVRDVLLDALVADFADPVGINASRIRPGF